MPDMKQVVSLVRVFKKRTMDLPRTILPCAIALLVATCGMAQEPAPVPNEGTSRPDAASQAIAPAPWTQQGLAAKLTDPLLARASAETIPPPPRREGAGTGRAAKNHEAPGEAMVDPYLAPKPAPLPAQLPPWTPEAAGQGRAAGLKGQGAMSSTIIDPNCIGQNGPYYDVTVDTLLWRLEATRGQPMILNPVLGTTIRTDDLDLGFQSGPRVAVELLSDEEEEIHSLEVGYFGVYNWFDRITEVAPAGTFLRLPDHLGDPGVTTDFAAASQMEARYNVRLNSVELNLFFGERESNFHWAVGPRFIRLEEYFNLDSFTAGRSSFYQVDTRNDLWGVQWVGRWRRTRRCWELTGICKVGVYDNQASQSTLMTDNDRTVVLRDFANSSFVASFVLDAGINLAYQINGTWLARAGYNVFVMDNVARATDQLDFSNSAISGSRLFLRQDALAHGLNFGLEARW